MSKNTLSTHIKEKLDVLRIGKERCMYKVHELLRDVNEKAYKPTLLAIGPYHHSKVGQGFMEGHKLCHLRQMLERTEGSIETYIIALRELEERARNCYVECISQTSDQFVEMMLLDGCFIIELFRKYEIYKETGGQEYDPIFQKEWMLPRIARDLLIFENQLPFFVIAKLFDMSESNKSRNLVEHINAKFEHLLGLIHATICISILDTEIDHAEECQEAVVKFKKAEIFKHVFGLIGKVVIPLLVKMKKMRKAISYASTFQRSGSLVSITDKLTDLHGLKEIEDWTTIPLSTELLEARVEFNIAKKFQDSSIHSATELEEAGIKFKKAEESSFFSLKFNNGLMEISPLSIQNGTETYLRNLIAYEQYCDRQNGSNYVYNYVRFMDHLINSPKDVKLLRQKGIISNCLGDDEIISTMVNKLGHYISFSTNIYARTFKNLNMHCKKRRNIWMAKLRRDYFNSPWALLSFLGAVLLLALAIAQTVFSIIP
ncbi:hypothetical protein I3842_01G108900 [Carya illinoinensis]|uniref:Uncharacterized protein n=1 Tax=Carya illinoinensis TaxID=32201 RepID=A0A922G1Z9_CARIL|nr:hypothetical protein I3842_01G108900 [Carya illinoinensis]